MKNKTTLSLALTLLVLGAFWAGIASGEVTLSPSEIGQIIMGNHPDAMLSHIFLNLRLPRALFAFLVGAVLATTGVTFQGVFRNPLADPFVIGVSGGAALGAAFSMAFHIDMNALFAFLFAIVTIFIVFQIAEVNGRIPTLNLLLAGFAVSSFATAMLSLIIVYANNQDMARILYWLMGSFAGRGSLWEMVLLLLPVFLLTSCIMLRYARELNMLSLDDESSQAMGVATVRVKRILILTGTFATAAAVSGCGIIGFVGLVIPHMTRLMTGPDHRKLLPISALIGGSLLLIADAVVRQMHELPVSIITSLIGIPFFIILLKKSIKGS